MSKVSFLSILCLIFFISCKTQVEKRMGEYTVDAYTYHGADSLRQLHRNKLDGPWILRKDQTFSIFQHAPVPYTDDFNSVVHPVDSIFVYNGNYSM